MTSSRIVSPSPRPLELKLLSDPATLAGTRKAVESFAAACGFREVAVGEMIESLTHQYPERKVHLRFFRCAWLRHEPQPLGCVEFAWISPRQLSEYEFPEADARLLEKLRASPEWCCCAG